MENSKLSCVKWESFNGIELVVEDTKYFVVVSFVKRVQGDHLKYVFLES